MIAVFNSLMKKDNKNLTGVKEIARRANVSIATVDRVIHNRIGVSKQTKEKIRKIIEELNYQPNLLAQRLASSKVIRIATLIPIISEETSFWQAPLEGIERAYSEVNQFGVVVDKYFYDQNYKDSFVEQADLILQSKPDGVLLAPSFIEESVSFTNKCKELNIPYVLIDSDLPNHGYLSYIGPNLYQSGYVTGHLMSYFTDKKDKVLVVNIAKEIDKEHHLLKKEEGVRAYFKDHNKAENILKVDVTQTDYKSIERALSKQFNDNDDIKVVFVTNSRVSQVAQYIKEFKKDIILIGCDFLKENVDFMNKGLVDFLICQKPKQQAYRAITFLYQHLAFSLPIEKIYFMPIDIITKENCSFYRN